MAFRNPLKETDDRWRPTPLAVVEAAVARRISARVARCSHCILNRRFPVAGAGYHFKMLIMEIDEILCRRIYYFAFVTNAWK